MRHLFKARPITAAVTTILAHSLFLNSHAIADDSALERIEVWAQKQKQPVTEVPVSLHLLSLEQIQALGNPNIEELTQHIPGVFASPNSNASKLFIRGIGSQGNAGMDQNTSVYIDNVYHGRSRMIKSGMFDIEQLEVLKGPQSLHFGLNSTAGAFSVRTLGANTKETGGYLQAEFGENQTLGFGLVKNVMINDNTAVRAVIKLKESDGYWDMISPDTGEKVAESDTEDKLFRLSGLWQSDEVTVRIKAETQEAERNNPFAWQPTGCDNLYGLGLSSQNELNTFWQNTGSEDNNPLRVPFTCRDTFIDNQLDDNSPSSPFNTSSFDYHILQSNISWKIAELDFELTSAWYDTEFEFAGNDLSHGANFHRIFSSYDNIHQHSHELRINSSIHDNIVWTAGIYWHDNYISYGTTDADGRRRNQEHVALSMAMQEEERLSVYASLDWQFDGGFTVSPGLRWASTDKTFSGTDNIIQVQRQPEASQGDLSALILSDVLADPNLYNDFNSRIRNQFDDETLDYSGLMPSVVFAWQQSANTRFYYKWQKGLKGGGFNFRLNNLDDTNLRYQEESVYAQELGVKGDLFDGQLSYAAALFQSRYADLQQNSNQGEDGFIGGAFIRNIARASSDGLELDIIWQPIEALEISWQSTWLSAKFDSYPGADCTRLQSVVSNTDVASQFAANRAQNCFQDLSGATMPLAPEFSSNMAFKYVMPVFTDMKLSSTLSWQYSDEFFTSPHADPLRKQDSYHKANLGFALEPNNETWKLSLYINNLTGELTSRQLGQDGNAAVSGLIDPPRYWFLQATYKI